MAMNSTYILISLVLILTSLICLMIRINEVEERLDKTRKMILSVYYDEKERTNNLKEKIKERLNELECQQKQDEEQERD